MGNSENHIYHFIAINAFYQLNERTKVGTIYGKRFICVLTLSSISHTTVQSFINLLNHANIPGDYCDKNSIYYLFPL